MTNLTFSSIDYYKNAEFQRLMRNWNKYISYEGDEVSNEALMFEWEEVCLKDFLKASSKWYHEHGLGWGKGLE